MARLQLHTLRVHVKRFFSGRLSARVSVGAFSRNIQFFNTHRMGSNERMNRRNGLSAHDTTVVSACLRLFVAYEKHRISTVEQSHTAEIRKSMWAQCAQT